MNHMQRAPTASHLPNAATLTRTPTFLIWQVATTFLIWQVATTFLIWQVAQLLTPRMCALASHHSPPTPDERSRVHYLYYDKFDRDQARADRPPLVRVLSRTGSGLPDGYIISLTHSRIATRTA